MKIFTVPTGEIITENFTKGPLEFLSIGDYGQSANIKADFLGITRPINAVPNVKPMPLSEKWVITISTQYGCNMKCVFCDVPSVGKGRNVSAADMLRQIKIARDLHPEVTKTSRLNIHFARMGEPSFNRDVLKVARLLASEGNTQLNLLTGTLHPVFTTMMPNKNAILSEVIHDWVDIKNHDYKGEAGLQVSINSTDNAQRDEMYQGCSLSLEDIAEMVKDFSKPVGRKYCINMAMADGYEGDGDKLAKLFNPEHWMVKITPIHVNTATMDNGIKSTGAYDLYDFYAPHEESFKAAGFDTLIFIPSYDEDEGMITCGNAVLSGRTPTIPYFVREK